MAKLIKKSKCKFENGYIIHKSKTVGIDPVVWHQLNELELIAQQYLYLVKQPAYQKAPSLEGFERTSALKFDRQYVDMPDTPVTDRRVDEALKFIEEMDKTNDAKQVNEMIDRYGALIDWCNSDKFIEGSCDRPLDLWEVGDPLTLNADDIIRLIKLVIENPVIMEG